MCTCGQSHAPREPKTFKTIDTNVNAPYPGMTQEDLNTYNFRTKVFEVEQKTKDWLPILAILGITACAAASVVAMNGGF